MRPLFLKFASLAAALVQPALAQPANPPPACTAPENRAFDFWVGEWKAYVTGTDNLAGLSTITREDGGCVITEHWRSQATNFTGRSLNIYSAGAKHWEQFWVDSTGGITHFIGHATPDGMDLIAEGDAAPGQPTPVFTRMIFTHNADGTVRQRGQTSADRGKTWTDSYDFTYRPTPKG